MDTLEIIRSARTMHRHVYVVGNGGSYANSMHVCNDLLSVGVKAHCFDPATLTAFANDYEYESAIARWISVVAERHDVLIALSGSGKSRNILNALAEAEIIGMTIIKVFGNELSLDMQQSEEYQLVWGHDLWRQLKN